MIYIKRCQHGEEIEFRCHVDAQYGGYIRLSTGEARDPWRQICKGGGFGGSTLSASSEQAFKAAVDRWVRKHRKAHHHCYDTCYCCGEPLVDRERRWSDPSGIAS